MKLSLKSAKHGFSLVEMLVVIAVIGIIAAIAIPNVSQINGAAKKASSRRNAQGIASIFAAAKAAGHDFSAGGTRDKAAIIDAIIAGKTITDAGPYNGAYFGIPGLIAEQAKDPKQGAIAHLKYEADTGILKYTGTSF